MQNSGCPLKLWNCTSWKPVGVVYDSEDTQIFSAVPVFSYIQYFKHRIPDELLYSAHIKYLIEAYSKYIFLWRVTLVWQEDQALLAHLELVSQDLWYVYLFIWWEESRTESENSPCFPIKIHAKLYYLFSFLYCFLLLYIYIIWLSFPLINWKCFQFLTFLMIISPKQVWKYTIRWNTTQIYK